MLLFKKKDLLVVISKSGDTVQFTKPLKDILKYQHRYNYKFVMYENGKVTVADDYIIEGETLTVLFGSATVAYTSEGATYTEGGSGGGSNTEFYIVNLTTVNDTITIDKSAQDIIANINKKTIIFFDNQIVNLYIQQTPDNTIFITGNSIYAVIDEDNEKYTVSRVSPFYVVTNSEITDNTSTATMYIMKGSV